jgi:hypothetical protein
MPSLGHLWRRMPVGTFQATLAVIALALSLLACGENTVQEPASNPKPGAVLSGGIEMGEEKGGSIIRRKPQLRFYYAGT